MDEPSGQGPQNLNQSFLAKAPEFSLPKGGGAIRGMGEKFGANPVTGTGSMSVPIATSAGRSGFGPQLSVSYDSGAGNGPFGFGWSLSLPSITRKTDKGLPQYHDAMDSDVFVLSSAEDLVPVLVQDARGKWEREILPERTVNRVKYRLDRFRPRIEGLFARIERWTNTTDATDVFWRSISKDNITTWYGKTAESRIFDPADPSRIFSWLISQSHDDKGNVVAYVYKPEDSARIFESTAGKKLVKAHERNRTDASRSAQRYLKRIRYGNQSPYFPALTDNAPWPEPTDASAPDGSNAWHFEVVFDYGEHDTNAATPNDARAWPARSDPFSSCRAGFEVRTYRICQRVLMFHHFLGSAGVERDCLVRSTDFTYSDELDPTDVRNPVYTFLRSITQTGYRRIDDGYDKRSLPRVEFEYTEPIVQDAVEEVDPQSLENVPVGLDGGAYRWTDLHGEGIPGILSEQANAWFYKRNLSPIPEKPPGGKEQLKAKFAPLETVALKPNVALSSGAEFMDLAGDGQPDVVEMDGPDPGLYEHDEAEGWQTFRPFASRLNRELRDPNLKFVDLDGDGHADVLITEDDAFVWHASLAEEGFGPARRVAQALDEEHGPRIVFADGTQSIYLADLSGDGLTDIARIRNGEVCYWPNLGYGRFGARVAMDNAPHFDNPDQFDPKRIRLADIDGSGTTDIIYLHRDGVRLFFNQSGNSWSQPYPLKVFPRVDDVVSIVPTDLLGNGTACLVWSSPLPGDARRPMHYVNLMGRRKPHLLVKTFNNLGAETRVDYAPSTKFYLQDKRDGKPWITRLPFPVHVVERVETYDHISRNRFVTRYAYHHGYFDGEEREFRGFGMVEQWDTEHLAALAGGDVPADNIAATSHVPPVHTKSWFHTGVYLSRAHVSDYFAGLLSATDRGEYFREPGLDDDEARALLLPDTMLPTGLSLDEAREACRALKGSMLRQEVYADDAGQGATPERIERARAPYTVTEQNFSIRVLQTRGANRHAAFLTHAREAISYHYERNPADPRIQHALTLEVDDYGNVLKQAAIGYGRRKKIRVVDEEGHVQEVLNPGLAVLDATDQPKQTTPLLTYTENRVTNAIESPDGHRNPLPCETLTFELTSYAATGPVIGFATDAAIQVRRFQDSDLVEPDPALLGRLRHKFTAPEVAYEAAATGPQRRRPIEWLRTLYRRDDLGSLLPLSELHLLALPGESYKLAFTPGLLTQVFQRPHADHPLEALLPNPAAVLGGQGGSRGGYLQSQTLKVDGHFPASDADDHWWTPSGQSFYTTNPADNAAAELAQARQHFFLPRRYRDPFGQDAFVDFDDSDLLMVETRDALGNRVTVEANDYRVLQPRLVSDPNRNRTEFAFDTLGLVVATAVMGKPPPAPVEGDSAQGLAADPDSTRIDAFFDRPRRPHPSLQECEATPIVHTLLAKATTRIVYDIDRFSRTQKANPEHPDKWEPPFAATIVRETHVSDLPDGQQSRLQVSFSYSDGFGREIQKKVQAETMRADFADAVLADNPVAYFRLGEPLGAATVRDSSPQANHAAVSASGVALGVPGLGSGDTAALFDGQGGGRIVIPERPVLKPKRIAIEAIVSWSGPNGFGQRIVEKSFSSASPTWPSYSLNVLGDGTANFELVVTGRPGIDAITSNAKLAPNVTTHLVATYDGNRMAIYVNGVLDKSQALVGEVFVNPDPGDIGIGNQVDRNRPFNGVIDEIAIYDQALPDDRIRDHFQNIRAPRWVGSGWTVFNNKGSPVRKYEPFFSRTHRFEFGVEEGVSPVLFYDPAGRVIATLHPNHTYEKVAFDPWQQTTYDVNDTCALRNAQTGDPRTDPDMGGYVAEYFKTQPTTRQTWYAQRIGGALGQDERNAALRAAAHADTPTTAHFDALGRPFLTVARNRVVCTDHDLDGTEDSFATRVELDIEGNLHSVRDAVKHTEARDAAGNPVVVDDPLGRIVMRYAYDMLGNLIYQLSMEAGARWMLNDVAGKPIRAWDSRGHNFTTTYDALRRPVEQTVRGTSANGGSASDPRTLNRDILVDKIEYGEPTANASQADLDRALRLNLRTRIYRHFDSAGVATNARLDANGNSVEAYDFKGNLLRSTQRLATAYWEIADWLLPAVPQLDAEFFEGSTRYDALNRPIQSVAPHSSLTRPGHPNKFNVTQPVFNEANLLERVDMWLERAAGPAALLDPDTAAPSPVGVANIDHDAKGQRQRIDFKNGASTFYEYDPLTFRLRQLRTRRNAAAFPGDDPQPPVAGWPGRQVQNLHYTYDPAGNITHIHDDAQQSVYFRNQRVEPSNDYTYDALYRLIQAHGREHLGQLASEERRPPTSPDAFNAFHTRKDHPSTFKAMGRYAERYVYDGVGNFLQMQHRGTDPAHAGWTRTYDYLEASLIEDGSGGVPLKTSNRLSRSTLNPNGATPPQVEPYQHDTHGNMVRMPHLGDGKPGPNMHWDYKDRLRQIDLGGGGAAFYVYNTSGQRVRKVWKKGTGGLTEERIYLGGFEIFRKHGSSIGTNTATLERETLHVMDNKQRVALVESRTLGNEPDVPQRLIRYQLGNHLGSSSLELNEEAQIVSYEEYAPYGSSTYQAMRGHTETAKRYRYSGKERDEESGLYYHGARHYGPWLARWTSTDPEGLKDGINVFGYVRANPVNLYDESGRFSKGTSSTSIGHFISAVRQWSPDALKHRHVYASRAGVQLEPSSHALTRIFDNDFRELNTKNQIVSEVGGKDFSYRATFLQKGKEKTQQKYIDLGLPLDVEHFFRVAALSQEYPDFAVRSAYIHQEFEQTRDTRPAGRTSAFAPEDLFSNELGLIFGTTVGETLDDAGFDYASELETYLKEARTLFTTNKLSNGKYLTPEHIKDLRGLAMKYYGTDDLSQFLKTSKIYKVTEIMKINDNAAVGNYPFYNNPLSAKQFEAREAEAAPRRQERGERSTIGNKL